MRKIFYALLLLCLPLLSVANPGDTTWVQAQNNIQLNNFGAFDAPVVFPNGSLSYRKIYLVFTLGTYPCPSGSQYCHQWDYDVHDVIMSPAGDTVELSRFITPYANTGVPRFPSTWTHRYIFDVTDYYPLLKGNNTFRIFYSGYSYGFTANVRFAFVEGTPERNVLGVTKLWGGSFAYGNAANPIDNNVTAVTRTAPLGTQSTEMKVLITGHGSDANQCCEFASHSYEAKVNGNSLGKTAIWRADCGSNEVYPQGGTWIYDRANWCPGATVTPYTHKLTGVTGLATYTTDLDFDAYTNTNTSYGSYNLQANALYYAAFNKTTDASLEDIIAPSDYEGHYRENPSNGQPAITIRNTGRDTITTMQIEYGVKDSAMSTYTMAGLLRPLHDLQVNLPELPALKKLSLAGATGSYTFVARIVSVNGIADNDPKNDTLRSTFTVAPTWPNAIVVYMKTNSAGVGGVGQNPSETSWKITDASGAVVASRSNADVSTVYSDTVSVSGTGMYKLTVTDGGCDGLYWWVYGQTPQLGITAGNIVVRDAYTGASIPVKGSSYSGTYHDDFGCGFSQSFSSRGWSLGVSNTPGSRSMSLQAFPNPAKKTVQANLYGLNSVAGTLSIIDVIGRQVLTQETHAPANTISISTLAPGIYTLIYQGTDGERLSSRLTVTE